MSIIEQIKNGAKFRHKDGYTPIEWKVFNNKTLVVVWENFPDHITVYKTFEYIELIP